MQRFSKIEEKGRLVAPRELTFKFYHADLHVRRCWKEEREKKRVHRAHSRSETNCCFLHVEIAENDKSDFVSEGTLGILINSKAR